MMNNAEQQLAMTQMTQLTLMMGTTTSESSLEFSIQYLWSTGWICFKRNEFIWMWSNGRALT